MVTARVRAAYDAIASAFAVTHAAMPPDLIAVAERLVGLIDQPGQILDVGCGSGRDMAWFEARGVGVVGFDLSDGMLAEAQRRTRGPLVQGDMRRLPFRDEHFSAVWSITSLLHLPKVDAPVALREMRRVVRGGGHLVLTIHEGDEEVWESGPLDVGVERFFARYSIADMEGLLGRAGFAVLEWHVEPVGQRRYLRFLAVATSIHV